MAILRPKQIREMSKKDLQSKFVELKKELVRIKAQISKGTLPENPGRTKEVRRTIARINHINKEVLKEKAWVISAKNVGCQ